MSGLPWHYALMEDTFHMPENEWSLFAAFFSDVMSEVSLRDDVGCRAAFMFASMACARPELA